MKLFLDNELGKKTLDHLSFPQTKQAVAIMDSIARFIPHEGVDYDVEITFKGDYNPSVTMKIIPITEKGVWWQQYVMEMMKKYPPSMENPEMSISDEVPDEIDGVKIQKDTSDGVNVDNGD